MLSATSKKTIDDLCRRFWLTDWRINARSVPNFVPDDGHLGDVELSVDYKTATITIYPEAIEPDARSSEMDVVVHEFGEIIAAQACSILAEETYNSDALVRVRDRFAEHFTLIIEGLRGDGR